MKELKPFLLIAIPEVILGLLVYLGVWFKILHWSFANLTLTISLLTLATYYMLLGILIFSNVNPKDLMKNPKGNVYTIAKMIFGLVGGLCMAVVTIGLWESMLKLPMAQMMLTVGAGFLILLTLVSIGVSFKYPHFLLVWVRLLLSVLFIWAPFVGLSLLRR